MPTGRNGDFRVLVRRRIRSFSAKVGKDLRGVGVRLPYVRILTETPNKPKPTAKNFSAAAQNPRISLYCTAKSFSTRAKHEAK